MTAKPSILTLTKRADYLRLNRGKKYITPYFILRYAATAGEGCCRVGYTVTTKCGNAVVRNRIKRRLRALVRELATECRAGTDYVLIARADAEVSAADAPIDALRDSLARALQAAHHQPPRGMASEGKGSKPPSHTH